MAAAETTVPAAYSPEHQVRVSPVPAMKSSTKTEIRNDCPGAEAAKAIVARRSVRA